MKKIIDCFTFFNEIDLLEVRIKYLYEIVDFFIIIESNITFTGNQKRMNFEYNKDRFKKYSDKIIYCSLDMAMINFNSNSPWEKEIFQRNSLKSPILNLNLDYNDMILISDIDEIPNKLILKKLKVNDYRLLKKNNFAQNFFYFLKYSIKYILKSNNIKKKRKYALRLKFMYNAIFKKRTIPINFKMHFCYYYLNYRRKDKLWNGLQCFSVEWLKNFTIDDIRNFRKYSLLNIKSGWHFSYLGGTEMIKNKLMNFSHQEYNVKKIVSDDYINFCIENGYDLFEYYLNTKKAKKKFYKINVDEFPNDLKTIILKYDKLILK